MDNHLRGKLGEDNAVAFLQRQGYEVLDRNFRCRLGEIDIIARKENFIVFVEVKLRKSFRYGTAREYVTLSKQRKIILAAEFWLAGHPTRLQPRFDVVELYAPEGADRPARIEHIPDAFRLN